ncbi:MAG TPA: DUF4835 family protein [Chitinophagaceae bacterium]|jgi:hypothetical protein|nr:DUF4835 family protein [Chitinophagaceae bacterium]
MLKRILTAITCLLIIATADAQEIQARLTVMTNKISTVIDKKVFTTLQNSLTNFLNNRKWTPDQFAINEKIQCNFLLSIEKEVGNPGSNVYQAKLTVQAARPIYNTTYDSPIINFIDDDVTFRYIEYQPIEFNENRIQGTDPVAANLPAVLAYYVYIILGMDYDSFSLRGGDAYFQKAWNIVNNAPEGASISGWRSYESLRNRYWLAENFNSNRFALVHDVLYAYYRSGFDKFYENEEEGRNGIFNSLNFLNTINTENPNSMLMQFFFQGKSAELVRVFSKAKPDLKVRARDILSKLDITNTLLYKELK